MINLPIELQPGVCLLPMNFVPARLFDKSTEINYGTFWVYYQ